MSDMMKKNVVITGAAGNLGRAAINGFAQKGYSVIAAVHPEKPLNGVVPEGTTSYSVDLLDEHNSAAFVKTVTGKHGPIDVALLLAGGYAGGDISQTDGRRLKDMLALNFETAYNVVRPIFMQMMQQDQGGRIVLVGARTALEPNAAKNSLAYGLSKSLLFTLAGVLNAEGAEKNVVTSVIVPSTIDTPENRQAMPKADFSKWVKPEKIAEILLFIASSAAHPIVDPVFKIYGNTGGRAD